MSEERQLAILDVDALRKQQVVIDEVEETIQKAIKLEAKHTPIMFTELHVKNNTPKSLYVDRYTDHATNKHDWEVESFGLKSFPIYLGGMAVLKVISAVPPISLKPQASASMESEETHDTHRILTEEENNAEVEFKNLLGCTCGTQRIYPDGFRANACFSKLKCIGTNAGEIDEEYVFNPKTRVDDKKTCKDVSTPDKCMLRDEAIDKHLVIDCDSPNKIVGVFFNPIWFDSAVNVRFQRAQNILFVNMDKTNEKYSINNQWITDLNKAYFKNIISFSHILQEDYEFDALEAETEEEKAAAAAQANKDKETAELNAQKAEANASEEEDSLLNPDEKRRLDKVEKLAVEAWADYYDGKDGKDPNYEKRHLEMGRDAEDLFNEVRVSMLPNENFAKEQIDKLGQEDLEKFIKQRENLDSNNQKSFFKVDTELETMKNNKEKLRTNDIFNTLGENYGVKVEIPTVLEDDMQMTAPMDEHSMMNMDTEAEDAHVPPPQPTEEEEISAERVKRDGNANKYKNAEKMAKKVGDLLATEGRLRDLSDRLHRYQENQLMRDKFLKENPDQQIYTFADRLVFGKKLNYVDTVITSQFIDPDTEKPKVFNDKKPKVKVDKYGHPMNKEISDTLFNPDHEFNDIITIEQPRDWWSRMKRDKDLYNRKIHGYKWPISDFLWDNLESWKTNEYNRRREPLGLSEGYHVTKKQDPRSETFDKYKNFLYYGLQRNAIRFRTFFFHWINYHPSHQKQIKKNFTEKEKWITQYQHDITNIETENPPLFDAVQHKKEFDEAEAKKVHHRERNLAMKENVVPEATVRAPPKKIWEDTSKLSIDEHLQTEYRYTMMKEIDSLKTKYDNKND